MNPKKLVVTVFSFSLTASMVPCAAQIVVSVGRKSVNVVSIWLVKLDKHWSETAVVASVSYARVMDTIFPRGTDSEEIQRTRRS